MTISQEPRPDLVRRIGAMGPNVGGAEYLIPLEPDELIATAVRATGLADFGPPSWEEPFRRLVTALGHRSAAARPGPADGPQRPAAPPQHPAAGHRRRCRADPSIPRSRCGARLHHRPGPLRHQHPARVARRGSGAAGAAGLGDGASVPAAAGLLTSAPSWAEPEFDLWADINPAFGAVHELKASLPEECLWLFAPEFDSGFWATNTDIPSFLAWRAGTDPLPAYRMHKLMLQVLQHQSPGPPGRGR